MGTGGRRAMGVVAPGSLITAEKVVEVIKVAEALVGSPLFDKILGRVEFTPEQRLNLEMNSASYEQAIKESKAGEATGRYKEPAEEGDTD